MTSNIELLQMAKQNNIYNLVVCMNDQLKNYKYPKDGYFILNLEDSDHGGTHWVILCVKNAIPCYFDSFGGIYSEQVESYLKKNYGKKVAFSAKIIQDFKSQECGIYCIVLVLYIKANPHLDILQAVNEYTNLFSSNPKSNDKILKKLFQKLKK